MSIKCQVMMDVMEKIAPRHLAESWDNVGLMIGSPSRDIQKIMVCLDVSEAVIKRSIEQKVDCIISHHPFIFKAMKNLRMDLPQGRLIEKIIKNGIVIFSAHTNLDIANHGVNDVLAEKLSLKDTKPLSITDSEALVKLVVFIPEDYVSVVQMAIAKAGAGHIGNYSHCTFQVKGQGTFMPLAGTIPFIGKQGKLEYVNEVRLETIMPEKIAHRVVRAMMKAHPYEEVAYDLYPVKQSGEAFGLGRIGKLEKPLKALEFIQIAKESLKAEQVRFVGDTNTMIQKVAICSGSGAEFIGKAAYAGADLFVTGDLKYHDAQRGLDAGICILDAGHFATEMPVVEVVAKYLQAEKEKQKWDIEVVYDDFSQDVFTAF